VAVVTALILFIIRLTSGVDFTGVVGALGSLATGAAAASCRSPRPRPRPG